MDRPEKQRHEVLTWDDVDQLIDVLLPQIRSVGTMSSMVMITRGGTIPGGMLAESMGMTHILTAAVDFPATALATKQNMLMSWPEFIQFPAEDKLMGRATLIVDANEGWTDALPVFDITALIVMEAA